MNARRTLYLFLTVIGFATARAIEPRTALVIGNEHYEATVGPLRNTANDAKAMARALRGLGFSVIERHDLTRDQLLRAVEAFRQTLAGAEVGLFYYAGHGLSVEGENYLVPIKSGFNSAGADETTLRMLAETRLFNAEQAVADMATAGAKCNLVILDACRTTQLPAVGRTRAVETRGGLAEMTPPAGSLIAFATDAGRTAFDGEGVNGLYTEELIKNLTRPGLTVEQVFKRTRAGVLKRSDSGQMPAEYSRLVGDDIYLAGEMPVATAIAIAPPAIAPTPVVKSEAELLAEATKFAGAGQATSCVKALETLARAKGPGDYAAKPLEKLLERAKNDLKDAVAPSPKVIAALASCEAVLRAIPECLPKDHPRAGEFEAKAQNRRGDALFLLGRIKDALAAYNSAFAMAPDDAYIRYNRGRASLALGDKETARADFQAASASDVDQPGARKLATKALAELK